MKTWGNGGVAPPFFTSALDGGEWSASRPSRFTPEAKAPTRTHCIGSWVDPRAALDAMEKRKILPCPESNPGHPALRPSQSRFLSPKRPLTSTTLHSVTSQEVTSFEENALMHYWRKNGQWRKVEPDTSRMSLDAPCIVRSTILFTYRVCTTPNATGCKKSKQDIN
jgi:hypothetical protein